MKICSTATQFGCGAYQQPGDVSEDEAVKFRIFAKEAKCFYTTWTYWITKDAFLQIGEGAVVFLGKSCPAAQMEARAKDWLKKHVVKGEKIAVAAMVAPSEPPFEMLEVGSSPAFEVDGVGSAVCRYDPGEDIVWLELVKATKPPGPYENYEEGVTFVLPYPKERLLEDAVKEFLAHNNLQVPFSTECIMQVD